MLHDRIAGLGAGAANALFINQHETGSFPAFLDQWLAGYNMPAHIAYDGEAPHAVMQANRQTYGVAWPALDFMAARLVVSVGADFLDTWGASVRSSSRSRMRVRSSPTRRASSTSVRVVR
jgi:hypothetical protein